MPSLGSDTYFPILPITYLPRVTDLEGRSRCKNFRMLGLPESTESGRPNEFFAAALVEMLGGNLPWLTRLASESYLPGVKDWIYVRSRRPANTLISLITVFGMLFSPSEVCMFFRGAYCCFSQGLSVIQREFVGDREYFLTVTKGHGFRFPTGLHNSVSYKS